MNIVQPGVSALSGLTIDCDLDLSNTYQVKNLAAPASGEALRKGNADISNAEIAAAAAIAKSKLDLAGNIVNADIGAAANIAFSKLEAAPASLTICNTEVFSGGQPASWTDLDLSAVVGSNKALVILAIDKDLGSGVFACRKNGDTRAYYDDNAVGGCNLVDTTNADNYTVVLTDNSGIIEWRVSYGPDIYKLYVLGYIK